ncbi:Protein NRT1/ PTR FAMILY 5.8 [Linum perenne]
MNWGRSPSKNIQYSLLFGSLCLISFGQGGYNPSLQAFGAEQLECEDENLPCTISIQSFIVNKFTQTTWVGLCLCRLQEQPLFGGQKSNNVNTEEETSTKFLKNAKTVMRLLPIWAVLLIFAVIFQQPTTFFTNQGMTMERSIGTGSTKFMIPPATLQSSITISIILLMPLYDRILIPMSRFVTRSEKGISVMQRMGIGMFLSVIAMIIAALVEEKRLYISRDQTDGSSNVPMKIFWLLPQYILLGISDIFTVVGMQEFFYGEVPVKLRTLGIALYTSVFGVGSFMSSMLICLVELFASWRKDKSWFSDDMREARLDKYYWLLAILSSVTLVLYVILCQFYRGKSDYQQVVHDDVDHHPPETTCTL